MSTPRMAQKNYALHTDTIIMTNTEIAILHCLLICRMIRVIKLFNDSADVKVSKKTKITEGLNVMWGRRQDVAACNEPKFMWMVSAKPQHPSQRNTTFERDTDETTLRINRTASWVSPRQGVRIVTTKKSFLLQKIGTYPVTSDFSVLYLKM